MAGQDVLGRFRQLPPKARLEIGLHSAYDPVFHAAVNSLVEERQIDLLGSLAADTLPPQRLATVAKAIGADALAIDAMLKCPDWLSSRLPDLLICLKRASGDLYMKFLRKLLDQRPDLMGSAEMHALLHRELTRMFGAEAAQSIGGRELDPKREYDRAVKIVGVAKFRDEGRLAELCIQDLMGVCDHVIVYDDRSCDGSIDALKSRWDGSRLTVATLPGQTAFNEKVIYDLLFDEARARQATHILMLDADERLSPALADRSVMRSLAAQSDPGEAVTVRWDQFVGDGFLSYDRFEGLGYCDRLVQTQKTLLYADDGAATHYDLALHNPITPKGFPTRRLYVHDTRYAIHHFDKLNIEATAQKVDWYLLKDVVQDGVPVEHALRRYIPQGHILSYHKGKTAVCEQLAGLEVYQQRCNKTRAADIEMWMEGIGPTERMFLLTSPI